MRRESKCHDKNKLNIKEYTEYIWETKNFHTHTQTHSQPGDNSKSFPVSNCFKFK